MIAPFIVRDLVHQALIEDLHYGDQTTDALFPAPFKATGEAVAKENMVVAGLDVFEAVFKMLDPDIRVEAASTPGQTLVPGDLIARVYGDGRSILKGERTALNFMQRLSGVATLTRHYVNKITDTSAQIVDTRKTTPGWRPLEKHAVRLGGGNNHRFNLGDMVLIKDNHIALAGGVLKAVEKARSRSGHSLKIEVEVSNFEELDEAIASRAEIIMLDNMGLDEIKLAVKRIREKAPSVLTEVSGNVRLDGVADIARTGVDLISVGALTHSATAVDISLEMTPGFDGS